MCGREYYYYYYCREVYRVRLRVRTFPLKLAGVALELPETMLVAVLAASASALTLTSVGRVSMPRTRPRATGATSAPVALCEGGNGCAVPFNIDVRAA